MASNKNSLDLHPAWLCLVACIRRMCDDIELEVCKRYPNTTDVKSLRILGDIRKSSRELDTALYQLEEEHNETAH